MVALIGLSLMSYGLELEAYEIAQSYCPGTYDLVVGGQKIGGIAQRRFKTGLTTAAYISVAGDQAARAQLMAGFYQAAGADDSYPKVDPAVMTTLAHACGRPLDRQTYQEELIQLISHYQKLVPGDYQDPDLVPIFTKMRQVSLARTQSLKPEVNSKPDS